MEYLDPLSETYRRAFIRVRALCRYTNTLPQSCLLQGSITLSGDPVKQTALSDVYQGVYENTDVAVKVIRINIDNRDRVEKVCTLMPNMLLFNFLNCPGILRRGNSLDPLEASQCHTIPGSLKCPGSKFSEQVDEAWHSYAVLGATS